MKNRIIIFGSGRLEQDFIREIKTDDFIIGVDYAAYWLIENNIIPYLAIGDFDSVTKVQMDIVEKKCQNILKFDSQKDFTDMELAINEAVKMKPSEVVIYGAIGTRFDHTLVNIYLLYKFLKKSIPAYIRDLNNEIFLTEKKTDLPKNNKFKYISVLPITDSVTISLSGLKYSLDKKRIFKGSSLAISNEIISKKALIKVHSGTAIVIQSRD